MSTKIEHTGDNRGRVIGDLTHHGITRATVLDVTFNGGGTNLLTGAYTVAFEATGSLKRFDFGLGHDDPAVGDEFALEIHAEFKPV